MQVKDVYYPEVKSLLQRMTSASRIEIIQHNLRKGKIEKGQALYCACLLSTDRHPTEGLLNCPDALLCVAFAVLHT